MAAMSVFGILSFTLSAWIAEPMLSRLEYTYVAW